MAKGSNQEMNQLSKEALQTALIELLLEKEMDTITVTELTERAGVSRMTYYRHYESMKDIYHETLDIIFQEIISDGKQMLLNGHWPDFWLTLFTFCYEQQTLMKSLLNTNQNNYVLEYLNQAFISESEQPLDKYQKYGFIGMTYNLLREWTHNDFDISPKELADISSYLMNEQIQAVLPEKYFPHSSYQSISNPRQEFHE
ncbi:TetR/AcrR family transcriptional regulator [Aerococcaceae bacterium DSM 111020]|nr:TetR/AcrR family transcriptional regulator [Aerococcaceae bacterium DSM 111020]